MILYCRDKVKNAGSGGPEPFDHLFDEFAFYLASEHDTIVARIEEWTLASKIHLAQTNPHDEVKMYKMLFR